MLTRHTATALKSTRKLTLSILAFSVIYFINSINLTASALKIVENGKSDYVIIRPEKSLPAEVYASEELQKFVEKLTGVKLAIQTDAKILPAKAIILGNCKYAAKILGHPPELKKLGSDGFQLCTRPPYLLVIGGSQRGVLYGVYELLEKYGGIRWYSKKFSMIPKRRDWSLSEINDIQVPAFAIRDIFYYDVLRDSDFAARMRSNGHGRKLDKRHGGNLYYAGRMCHTFYDIMPPKEFYAKHPEYFSEWHGGKRRSQHGSLCLTNPDVLKIVSERVIKMLDKDPNASFVDLSATDGGTPCICRKCSAIDKREGTYAGSLINFCNQVAAKIEKKYPNVSIETLAYADTKTQTPPRFLKTRHNVIPRVCSVRCDFSRPVDDSPYKENGKFVKEMAGWKKVSDKLLVWDYVTNFYHYLAPFPNFNSLQGNMKYFKSNNVAGILSLGNYSSPHGEFAELRAWIISKLLWNPNADINKLYDDFFQGYYGAAASYIRKYFDELQTLSKPKKNILTIKTAMTVKWFPNGFFKNSLKLFKQAMQVVKDDPERLYNVKMAAVPVYYALFERWPKFKVKWEWKNGAAKPVKLSPEYAQLAEELDKLLKEGKITHIIEHPIRNSQAFNKIRSLSNKAGMTLIKSDKLKAGVVAHKGARVSLLELKDGHNYIRPELGGIDFEDRPKIMDGQDDRFFNLIKHNPASAVFKLDVRLKYSIIRTLQVQAESLDINTRLVSRDTRPRRIAPHIRLALDLGDADAIFGRSGLGRWQKMGVPANRTFLNTIIKGNKLISRDYTIASSATKRGVKIRLPELDKIDRLWINCDSTNKSIRLFIVTKEQTLPGKLSGKGTLCFNISVEPITNVPECPPTVAPIKQHMADIVELDDDLLPLVSLGWGCYAPDASAADGHAVRLNTFPSWCMQWQLKPELFDPNSYYKMQMLVRADKSGVPGEIFFAGIYDYTTRKSLGDVKPQDFEVKDGYQWYDVAVFKPAAKQRVWAGPGRYNRKQGEKSAVKHVYIDKIRFIKTDKQKLVKPEQQRDASDLVILEEQDIPVRSVAWSKYVRDKLAENGRAMKLTTYPTWNVMWDVKPEWFKPGKYKVSMRVRVEKSNTPGEAFRAGVYDFTTRKSLGDLIIKTANVPAGYKWYDVAIFTPGKKQRVWVGSGKYDRKGGKDSAVKGVYVDKIKFKKIKSQ
jgi:hypothetical protein